MLSLLQTNFWTVSRCIFVFCCLSAQPHSVHTFLSRHYNRVHVFSFLYRVFVDYRTISTSKLQLSCPVCCAGSFSSLSTLSSHSSHTLSLSLCSHVHHFVPVLYIKKEQQTNKQTNLFSHVLFHCHLFLRAYLVYNKYSRVAPPAQPHQQQHHHQQQIEKNKNNNNSVTDQQQQSQPPTTFRIFIVSFSSFGHF